MKKRIIVSTLLIGTLLTGGIAMAKSYGSGPCNGNGKNKGMMTEEQHQQRMENRLEKMAVILDLSDNQQEQIEALLTQHWQDRQEVREQMREGRDDRRAAMRDGDLDETAIRSRLAKQSKFKADRIVERAEMKQQIFALLSPEQQEKADKLFELRGNDRQGRHAKGFSF